MARPTITGVPANIFVSAAELWVDGIDIGFVSGVKVKVKHETTPVSTDQLGKSIVNHFYIGDTIDIEAMMDELTAAKLKTAFPHGSFISTGPAARLSWGKPIGDSYYSLAKTLEVKPMSDDVGDFNRNFKFWKAIPLGDAEIEEKPDGKAQIKVSFHVYPDLSQPDGMWYGYFGDNAAGTLVPAGFSAAVPGGGNVGNGTVSGIAVNNDFTQSETWTLTCIHAATNSGIFSAVGSVTGARGNATVASQFYSNSITPANSEITLLINDGATDFAVGDTFTIATTEKNYT